MASRIVVVTGGFGTLGRTVAATFAAMGDKVARADFADRSQEQSGMLDFGGVDIADPVIASELMTRITETIGTPNILVNIAGGFVWESLADGGSATWERMFRMNALTATTMSHAAAPHLAKGKNGRIINIGAHAALKAAAGMGSYAASKAAVHKLTESLAEELKSEGITVNAVLPTIIDTAANRADMPDADRSDWLQPQAIADVILFLASPAARAITGALIPLTRGTPA